MRLLLQHGDNADQQALYMAHFTHVPTSAARLLTLASLNSRLYKWETFCTVHKGACAKQARPCNTPDAHVGTARCSMLDPFLRPLGRKLAFGRAISVYPKPIRAGLWAEYLRQSKRVVKSRK